MLVSLDIPLEAANPAPSPTAALFQPAGARWLRGELRHYYYGVNGRRILLVLRHGLRLADLAVGDVLDASLGHEDGQARYVRPGDEGLRHTKMTVYRHVAADSAEPITPFSQIVAQAPRRLLP